MEKINFCPLNNIYCENIDHRRLLLILRSFFKLGLFTSKHIIRRFEADPNYNYEHNMLIEDIYDSDIKGICDISKRNFKEYIDFYLGSEIQTYTNSIQEHKKEWERLVNDYPWFTNLILDTVNEYLKMIQNQRSIYVPGKEIFAEQLNYLKWDLIKFIAFSTKNK